MEKDQESKAGEQAHDTTGGATMRSIADQLLTGMPAPDLSKLKLGTDAGYYAREITKANGRLYASKPAKVSPEARYVWRMVVYMVSPRPAHQCMPVTAHFELGPYTQVKGLLERLDAIADQIVDAIPVSQWHGVKRWGRALGYI